ncbi:MAG: hypothetical protein EP330_08300 [Deltaproteobacteria bacterium]|nr:MAG: hypothetical protein EP330_08300 [Deltaproteobacteria bacterium]
MRRGLVLVCLLASCAPHDNGTANGVFIGELDSCPARADLPSAWRAAVTLEPTASRSWVLRMHGLDGWLSSTSASPLHFVGTAFDLADELGFDRIDAEVDLEHTDDTPYPARVTLFAEGCVLVIDGHIEPILGG